MGPNTLLGVIFLAIGGFCSATSFIPFRQIKRWSWEVYWIVQGAAAWIVAPALATCLLVPNCGGILREAWQADPHCIWLALLFGMVGGVGAMAFGLAIRYLGFALGYAMSLGFCVLLGWLEPFVAHGQPVTAGHSAWGGPALEGLLLSLAGLAISSVAGRRKEEEMTVAVKLEAGEQDFNFPRGLLMAALAGLMSLFFALGLQAGRPIASLARTALAANGRTEMWANLPVLMVVLCGGFLTNLVWAGVLILRNSSAKQFLGEPGINPMRAVATSGDTLVDFDPLDPSTYDRLAPGTLIANYLFAALAGVVWYLPVLFYLLGGSRMGGTRFLPAASLVVSILFFAHFWGLALKEWRGTSARARLLATCGLCLVMASAVLLGHADLLHAVFGN